MTYYYCMNEIKENRDTPEQWDVVKIATVYKKIGSKKLLKYYRGIFLTLVLSKLFEALKATNRAKPRKN